MLYLSQKLFWNNLRSNWQEKSIQLTLLRRHRNLITKKTIPSFKILFILSVNSLYHQLLSILIYKQPFYTINYFYYIPSPVFIIWNTIYNKLRIQSNF